jgi:N-dimethylarginine dimethylaminohydrolase
LELLKTGGILASYSEYGTLQTVILGSVDDYQPAIWCWKSNDIYQAKNFKDAISIAKTAIPKNILEEVHEDLEDYKKILTNLGVKVIRPPRNFNDPVLETESVLAFGQDFYNMRDLHVVLGEVIVTSAPAQPNRILEIQNLRNFFNSIAIDYKMTLVQSPVPELKNNPERAYVRNEVGDLEAHEENTAILLGMVTPQIWHRLEEKELLFDAANLVRFGSEVLYLISSTGNRLGFDWLKKTINTFKFNATDVYRSSHLDSTILPLDEDTFLVNSVRVNEENLPQILKNKKILYFGDVETIPEIDINFHVDHRIPAAKQIENLGFTTNLKDMSSPWAGLNVLSFDEKTIMVESNQKKLINFLESHGYQIIPVRMRHPYTMLGGLHCTTLDLERQC